MSYGTAVFTLKQATSTIPIVFAIAIDPAGAGIVPSLARPGGNVTGLSIEQTETAGKRLELLRAVIPHLQRLAVIANIEYPQTRQEMGAVQTAARALGLDLAPLEIRRAEDIATGFAALKGQADALYIAVEQPTKFDFVINLSTAKAIGPQDTLTNTDRTQIISFALGARLPTIVGASDLVKAGALMSYGPNNPAIFRRAAEYVDKILRGASPGEIQCCCVPRGDRIGAMSANDPKRTTLERTIDLASKAKQLPIGQRNCPNNYDGMAVFPVFGGISLQTFVEVT